MSRSVHNSAPRLLRHIGRAFAHWVPALCMVLLPASALADLTVSMTANPMQVSADGRLSLRIEVSTDSLKGPEVNLPDLSDFQVLSQSVQRPMQFSFGLGGQQVRSSTQYTFLLQPLREGPLKIDPVRVVQNGQRAESKPLVIQVGPAGAGSATAPAGVAAQPGSQAQAPGQESAATQGEAKVVDHGSYVDAMQVDPEAFIRTVADKGSPYEGEQVTVTIYLYTSARLQAAPRIDQEPTTEGLWTQDLLEGQTLEEVSPQQVGGRRYRVYVLRRFAAFPLRAEEVTVGPMALTIEQPRNLFDMFGRGSAPKPALKRSGVALPLAVKPLPAAGRPGGDVAVGRYSIDTKLDRSQTATGDAVTMTAILTGEGQLQGARLTMPDVDGLEILQPQVRDLLETNDGRVGGTRVFEWLIVPQRPGDYPLPPLTLHSFDPQSERYLAVQGPALTLTAAGRVIETPTDTTQSQPAAQGASRPDPDKPLTFGPVRTQSELLRKTTPVSRSPWFGFAVGAPVLLGLFFLVRDARARRSSEQGPSAEERSRSSSVAQMDNAKRAAQAGDSAAFYPEVASALARGLEFALGEQVGSFTRQELRSRVRDAGVPAEVGKAVFDLLDRCDAARFAPGKGDPAELNQVLAHAQQLQTTLLAGPQGWKGGTQ